MVANTSDSIEASRPKDPLHGITLETILNKLVDYYGWNELGWRIRINCFNDDPSIKSSLKFLRKTPWARTKVEALYVEMLAEHAKIEREHAETDAAGTDAAGTDGAETDGAETPTETN